MSYPVLTCSLQVQNVTGKRRGQHFLAVKNATAQVSVWTRNFWTPRLTLYQMKYGPATKQNWKCWYLQQALFVRRNLANSVLTYLFHQPEIHDNTKLLSQKCIPQNLHNYRQDMWLYCHSQVLALGAMMGNTTLST